MVQPKSSTRTMPHAQLNNRKAAFEMSAAALAFSTMVCIAHGLGGAIAWPVIAFARIAVTSVSAFALIALLRAPLTVRGSAALWTRSLSGSVALLCTFYAVTHLPLTDVVTILSTSPLWMSVILAIFFREAIRPSTWFHALLAVTGVYIMHRPTFTAETIPIAITLGGAIVAAVAKVALSRCHAFPSVTVVAHYSTTASLVSLGLCFLLGGPLLADPETPLWYWAWLVPMGLAGTLGQVFMTRAYADGSTPMVALVGLVQIAYAAAYDVFLWGHRIDPPKALGVAVIAIAIILNIRANAKPVAGTMDAATVDYPLTANAPGEEHAS